MNGEGEGRNARRAMDDLVKRQVDMGVPVKDAEARAREVAKRADRREEERK